MSRTAVGEPAFHVVLKLRLAKALAIKDFKFWKDRLNARITVAGDILIPVYREHSAAEKERKI